MPITFFFSLFFWTLDMLLLPKKMKISPLSKNRNKTKQKCAVIVQWFYQIINVLDFLNHNRFRQWKYFWSLEERFFLFFCFLLEGQKETMIVSPFNQGKKKMTFSSLQKKSSGKKIIKSECIMSNLLETLFLYFELRKFGLLAL